MIITSSKMYRTDIYLQHSSIMWPVWLNGWVFVYQLSRFRFLSSCRHLNLRLHMIITSSQMHRTDIYLQRSSIIRQILLNDWVFVYEVSRCGFWSCCSHLNFRFFACFEQGVTWYSGRCRLRINSETCTWHDNNLQCISPYRYIITTQLNQLVSWDKWLSVDWKIKSLWRPV